MGPSAVIASLLIKLGLDPSGVEQGASAASRAMGGLTKHGTLAAAGMGFAVGDFVAQSAQRMMQFDDQMRQVFSILPGISQDAMDKMASQVRDLSKEYGVATDVVIPGLYDALSSGVPQDNVFAFMETAQKMAVAGVADTQQSVNLLTQVMNAYRLEAEDMVGVSDQMFMAVNKGVTTIPELSSALSSVTPIASSMGIGINEVLAAITAMTLQGSSTAESVTMMRSSLVALMKPLPALRLGLANAGYETGQAAIEALGYQGAMELMRDISEKTGTTLPKLTGRIEGTSAVLQLTGQNAEAARQALEDVTTAAGTTDSAFRIMQGGIGGTVRRMQAWMQDLSLTVGQAIEPIAPLFLAFGPQMGRWLGRGIGAGLGVAMKGIGGIVARAMPGLAATMTQIGADAGGSLAKGLGQSIATSIKSAGWRRLAFGGIAMAAGAALATGAFGDFGGIEKLAGSLLSIAGAFAVGGPVLGAIVALTMALQELGNFLGTVDRAQTDLNAKVAGIAQQSGQEALANLQNLTKTLREVQGLERMVADTWGGAQEVEALSELTKAIVNAETLSVAEAEAAIAAVTIAAAEAAARGNAAIETELLAQVDLLTAIRDDAAIAADGMYHRLSMSIEDGAETAARVAKWGWGTLSDAMRQGGAAAAAGMEEAGAVVTAEVQTFADRLRDGAGAISSAWDTLTSALSKGPRIMSMEKRMETARKAIMQNVAKLRKAIRVGDTVAAADYAQRVIDARAATRAIRGPDAQRTMDRAARVLANSRRIAARQHKGMADDAKRESSRGARAVAESAKKAGKAMPDEMRAARPRAEAAAKAVTASVKAPMESAATQATTWGQHLGANYAAGITSQTEAVATAAAGLAAAAAAPIKFSSPPRRGALSTIRTWGPHMVSEWLRPIHGHIRDVERMGDRLGMALRPDWQPAMVRAHDIDRLRVTRIRDTEVSGRARYTEVHFHIGNLIADDKGIDELERRIGRRRKMRGRGVMRYHDVD